MIVPVAVIPFAFNWLHMSVQSFIDNFVSGQLINSVVGCAVLDSGINLSDLRV